MGLVIGSTGTQYVYRFPRNLKFFSWDYNVSKVAARFNIGPQLLAKNDAHGCMVFEYIEPITWPSYEEDPVPYHECMHLLRAFHTLGNQALQPVVKECPHEPYFPFSTIQDIADNVQKGGIPAPRQLFEASKLVARIFKKLKPWIEKNGVIGHHDFHTNNCILSKKRAYIIDWTTAAPLSDPYNDVASFANILKPEQRLELLQTYLQKSTLSSEEKAHFRLCEITSYARIAALCFFAQRKTELADAAIKVCIEKAIIFVLTDGRSSAILRRKWRNLCHLSER